MFKPEKLEEVMSQVGKLLPKDLHQARQDIEKNMKSALNASLARMDIVTREEFDIQAELLARTRALLQEAEARISKLEEALDQKKMP